MFAVVTGFLLLCAAQTSENNATSIMDSLTVTTSWLNRIADTYLSRKPEEAAPVVLPIVAAPDAATTVAIDIGNVTGRLVLGNVAEYAGIPYAQPPLGNLRFAPPKPLDHRSRPNVLALSISPGCPQNCPGNVLTCPATTSEDCLYANVWTPTVKKSSSLPVFVFIHGGAFVNSHGGMYNGSRLAQQGMVVVTFNYRLGALGFLATDDLQGNYGLQDQQLLLRWVQINIHSFGGDPQKVTLGGQSAGGMSVGLHLVSKSSAGLFRRAIMESPFYGLPYLTRKEHVDTVSHSFIANLQLQDCKEDMSTCLRNASLNDIMEAQRKVQYPVTDPVHLMSIPHFTSLPIPFAPILQGEVQMQPMEIMRSGGWNKVPLLVGYTRDETSLFVQYLLPEIQSWAYVPLMKAAFRDNADEVLKAYPTNDNDQREVLQEWSRDLFIACPLRNMSSAYLEGHTFLYRYDLVYSNQSFWHHLKDSCGKYACHSAELPAVFHGKYMYDAVGTENATATEIDVAENLFRRFSSFIKYGNPNLHELGSDPYWQPYSPATKEIFLFDEHSSLMSANSLEKCDTWDRLGYVW